MMMSDNGDRFDPKAMHDPYEEDIKDLDPELGRSFCLEQYSIQIKITRDLIPIDESTQGDLIFWLRMYRIIAMRAATPEELEDKILESKTGTEERLTELEKGLEKFDFEALANDVLAKEKPLEELLQALHPPETETSETE